MALRLLTGLGLGAAMPNATTLLSEYTPERLKSLLVTSMFCGFNLGMACGGFVSAKMIPILGWHSLLMLGGILPLVLAVVLLFWLPESARFLVVRNRGVERIRKVLAPIAPLEVAAAKGFSVPEQKSVQSRNVLKVIFSGTYSAGTLLLWLTYFMGLVIVYLLTSWLPTLLRDSGASMEQSAFIGALFQFGGVLSAVGVGWAMDKFNPHKVIGIATCWRVHSLGWSGKAGQCHRAGHVGTVGRHVHQRCAIGDAIAGSAVLPNPGSRHRRVMDARYWSFRRDLGCLGRGDVIGARLELRAGADRSGGSGGVGGDCGSDQRNGQPCGRYLRSHH